MRHSILPLLIVLGIGACSKTDWEQMEREQRSAREPGRHPALGEQRRNENLVDGPQAARQAEFPQADGQLESSRPGNAADSDNDSPKLVVVDDSKQDSPLIGRPAPVVDLPALKGARLRSHDQLYERIVLLDFWSTDGDHSIGHLKRLIRFADDRRHDVVLKTINAYEEARVVSEFLQKNQVDVDVALDLDGVALANYRVDLLPTLVVIDREGIVRNVHVGARRNIGSVVSRDLEAIKGTTQQASAQGKKRTNDLLGDDFESEFPSLYRPPRRHFVLSTGERIDVNEFYKTALDAARRKHNVLIPKIPTGRSLRFNFPKSENLRLLVNKNGAHLDGPLISNAAAGMPEVYLNYRDDERHESFFVFHEGRPWIFEQYDQGQRDGLRFVCAALASTSGNLRVVVLQEWDRGRIVQSHFVQEDGVQHSFGGNQPRGLSAEENRRYQHALQQLSGFDADLRRGEARLRKRLSKVELQKWKFRMRRAGRDL